MTRVVLLANPGSGSGGASGVEQLLIDHGAQVSRHQVPGAVDLAGGPERIVVAGGDGSVGAAAELAAGTGVPLAVVPVGTANDFARSLGIPLDPDEAVELAVGGSRTRALELGRAGRRPFVNAASAGLSPIAAREAHGLKRRLGPFAYAVGGLRAGLTAHPLACRVRCDGEVLFDGRAWQATVACTGAFGGGAELDADPGDGVLHVVIVEAGPRTRLVLHAYGMRAGRIESQRSVIVGGGTAVEVETEAATGFNVDGELVSAACLRLTVEPRAFEVVVG